jgi:uncharacterized protein (DUF39 family)
MVLLFFLLETMNGTWLSILVSIAVPAMDPKVNDAIMERKKKRLNEDAVDDVSEESTSQTQPTIEEPETIQDDDSTTQKKKRNRKKKNRNKKLKTEQVAE